MRRPKVTLQSSENRTMRISISKLLVLVALFSVLPGCQRGTAKVPVRSPETVDSTREMAETLRSIANSIDPTELPIVLNPQRAEALQQMMSNTADPEQRESLRVSYATELLYAGQPEKALTELGQAEEWLKSSNPEAWNQR